MGNLQLYSHNRNLVFEHLHRPLKIPSCQSAANPRSRPRPHTTPNTLLDRKDLPF